ncbi:hypothetical protein IFM61606_10181 [Aspergillus udagawae]|nr:hypothetical protein IFM61606_10181 [Aspergillus udagawae]
MALASVGRNCYRQVINGGWLIFTLMVGKTYTPCPALPYSAPFIETFSKRVLSDLRLALIIDISSDLQAALVDEYLNEKVLSDGEVYLKVRQYQYEGNARFEEQWMARLTANKAKWFRQLTSRVDVRAAFDWLRIIPALLLQGMKFGSIPRALAMNCYEEMVHGLGSLLESWSYYVRGNREKMLKIDPYTVETLQGLAPSVSIKDATVVKGLVLSGEVFSKFTSSECKAIWKRLKCRRNIIPLLYTFFQDMCVTLRSRAPS